MNNKTVKKFKNHNKGGGGGGGFLSGKSKSKKPIDKTKISAPTDFMFVMEFVSLSFFFFFFGNIVFSIH